VEFETEIGRLTHNLMGAFESRAKAAADAHANTQEMLQTDQTNRLTMAADQQHQLRQHMGAMRAHVSGMRDSARRRMRDLHDAQEHMSAEQRRNQAQCLNELRQRTAAFTQQTAGDRAAMSRGQQQAMREFMAHLRDDNATFLDSAHSERRQSSADRQRDLNSYMANLRKDVDQMRADTATFTGSVAGARAHMAAEQDEHLSRWKAQLTADVTAARHESQSAQAAIQADHAAGHRQWLRFSQEMTGRRNRQPVEATPPVPVPSPLSGPALAPQPPADQNLAPPAPEPVDPPEGVQVGTQDVSANDDLSDVKKKMI
jgi:hypothetical protein